MREISVLSGKSVEIANYTSGLMEKIVPSIRNTSILVQEIYQKSKEQSGSTAQMLKAIGQLDSVTQQHASLSEELAGTAEELTSHALKTKNAVNYFRVKSNNIAKLN
jgi:methyl-accepting chemotaxis protein